METTVAEVKIIYLPGNTPHGKITCSKDCQQVLRPFFEQLMCHREAFYVLLLNRANRVIGVNKISEGGTSSTVVDVKIIAQAAILSHSSSVVVCHNHPSGDLRPSDADIALTGQVKEALNLFDIAVLDHIILTEESYYSFADEGLI